MRKLAPLTALLVAFGLAFAVPTASFAQASKPVTEAKAQAKKHAKKAPAKKSPARKAAEAAKPGAVG